MNDIRDFLIDKIKEKYIVDEILLEYYREQHRKKWEYVMFELQDRNFAYTSILHNEQGMNDIRYYYTRQNGALRIRVSYHLDYPNLFSNLCVLHVNRLLEENTILFDDLDPVHHFVRTYIYRENEGLDVPIAVELL